MCKYIKITSLVFMLMLSGCQANNTADTEITAEAAEETATIATNSDIPSAAIGSLTDEEIAQIDWDDMGSIEPYKKSEIYNDVYGKYGERTIYRLFFLNDDDIPELAVFEDCIHGSGAYIYTYADGRPVRLIPEGEYGEQERMGDYGEFSYVEKQGIILDDELFNGGKGSRENIFEWNGEGTTLKILKTFTDRITQDENSGRGSEKYFVDGTEVTKEEFSRMYEKYYSEPQMTVSYFDEAH